METVEIKKPKMIITLLFFLVTVIAFIGMMSSASRTEIGFSPLGTILIVAANIGFWGMVYRVSKHAQFYLKGRPGASFLRIVFVVSFIVAFIFLFSMASSILKNSDHSATNYEQN